MGKRSILCVCEHFTNEADAERALLYRFLLFGLNYSLLVQKLSVGGNANVGLYLVNSDLNSFFECKYRVFGILLAPASVGGNINIAVALLPVIHFENAWSSATEQKDNWNFLGDNVHPSAAGMTVLAELAISDIKKFYGIE